MFDAPQPQENPLNPVMPPPGTPPPPPAPSAPLPEPTGPMPQPQVFTMPDKFRTTGAGPKPSGGSKKLVVILIIVVVIGILAVGGVYVFQNYFNTPANTNSNANANLNTNTANVNTTVNANANENANANLNANTNVNTNATTNANSNANGNGNVNSTTNANGNVNAAVNTSPLPATTDTDSDGLTDVEEKSWTTDVAKLDTDGDTFADGKQTLTDSTIGGELWLGYNPTGAGKLEDATAVAKRVQNTTTAYSVLLPAAFTIVTDASGGLLINTDQNTGEFFQVQLQDNPQQLTPTAWYAANASATAGTLAPTTNLNGLEGVYSEDLSTAYLFKGTKVYNIVYNSGTLTQVNYRTTFDVIVRHFKLVGA